jgi:hypothetical protein
MTDGEKQILERVTANPDLIDRQDFQIAAMFFGAEARGHWQEIAIKRDEMRSSR